MSTKDRLVRKTKQVATFIVNFGWHISVTFFLAKIFSLIHGSEKDGFTFTHNALQT
jgi:hypothetical protein